MGNLVYGVGINDADYDIYQTINGAVVRCPFYERWANMLKRCYNHKFQCKYPTYIGCTVADEWLIFSNFKRWMETQSWAGKDLDKDLLSDGDRLYSPETCVFVDHMINNFALSKNSRRGDYPLGVRRHKCGKFEACCSNPITKEREHLGLFENPEQAHQAWKKRKHELACKLADLQTDERVAGALRTRYL